MIPAIPRLLAAALLASLATVALVPSVGAHGGDARIELVALQPGADEAQRDVVVRVTFGDDDHNVDDATVTIGGDSDDGDSLVPVTLQPVGDGEFSGTVDLPAPGKWSLTVTVVEPPGQLRLDPVVVEAASTIDTKPVTEDSVAEAAEGAEQAAEVGGEAAAGEDSSGFPVGVAVVVGLALLAAGAGWTVLRGGRLRDSGRGT